MYLVVAAMTAIKVKHLFVILMVNPDNLLITCYEIGRTLITEITLAHLSTASDCSNHNG